MQVQKSLKRYFFALMKKGETQVRDEILMDLIIHRMKELRSERGFTQEYVVENTGLNISQYEAKRNYPSLLSLSKLCNFYNITLSDFFSTLEYPRKK